MTLSGLGIKEYIMSNNYQYGENHADTSQNETSNDTVSSWEIGTHVTIIPIVGPAKIGVIVGPGMIQEI